MIFYIVSVLAKVIDHEKEIKMKGEKKKNKHKGH